MASTAVRVCAEVHIMRYLGAEMLHAFGRQSVDVTVQWYDCRIYLFIMRVSLGSSEGVSQGKKIKSTIVA